MNSGNDMTFSDLRSKDLINSCDGKRLGKACDIVFDTQTGKIRGIVAPYGKKSCFGKGQDIFIPFKCILKIGEDIVLVDINCQTLKNEEKRPCLPPVSHQPETPQPHECEPQRPDCDQRCEKCMLFDCAYRWKNN